jgi:branched-chain amino acid transport system ATP-binding protein
MGLAPLLMYEMFRTLKKLNEQGNDHPSGRAERQSGLDFAHRGYVLDTGEIVAQGTSDELKHDPMVKKAIWADRKESGLPPRTPPGGNHFPRTP